MTAGEMRLALVTPSFNQAAFLDDAIRSVLDQNYPQLEYVVMDGGSTDGSVAIIEKHAGRLAHWESGRDAGQYDAITRGFAKTSGEVLGWLNSDDKLAPWALSVVGEIFAHCPEVEWLTSLRPLRWDERGRAVRCLTHPGYSRGGFFRGENFPEAGAFFTGWIQQESTFWRRSLWERAGAQVGAEFKLAGDFELWARFFEANAELVGVETPLGGFRFHAAQKTAMQNDRYLAEASAAFEKHGGRRHSTGERMARELACCVPRGLRGSLARLGLLHPCKIARHNRRSGRWEIVTVYE